MKFHLIHQDFTKLHETACRLTQINLYNLYVSYIYTNFMYVQNP